ncbi:HypC/HybG/HupF family hydrogenase formation chaperone [Corynebacterium pyruviciproducens]|uniref:HypC/HybG/HupF family hydrogenase formation chaperone n=1 Tax=Corynebacterium pyruviciproducens TaxID=598660 RepID=A0AAF1BZB2_9CORY|nr:HypC/HybG/HupF family hydrogenase formation chaperone [Corynebacterium pyruviciproducens]MDK6564825.1 HypC/HybG/HupF family hydrogenase formation chaperone [Corynebacterium pyruviciproducens]WOT02510.1 HypC/HybG/HupF family hydrogenase formation chaperone [Corynebacterium pyruviciproducens]
MCLGVPAQVVDVVSDSRAQVSMSGVTRLIATDLLADAPLSPGDWVLVHVGFAISMIDDEEAQLTLQQIKQLGGNTYEDELASFTGSKI